MAHQGTSMAALGVSLLLVAGCDRAPADTEAHLQAGAATCTEDGLLRYVCGPVNAEDLLQIGSTRWLIASGMNGDVVGTPGNGHLYLIDTESRTWQELFPASTPTLRHDTAMFGDCPAPLDTNDFSAHGLALREQAPGLYHLYVTSHGAREAVEAFEVDITGEKPLLTWTGCVPLPPGVWANGLVMLPDGGFLATGFMDPRQPDPFAAIARGEISGMVHQWRPGQPVSPVPGTELSGPNGIAMSDDGKLLFVAAFGARSIVRFDLGSAPLQGRVAAMQIVPDNLRWTADGKLLTAGNNLAPDQACAGEYCSPGWSIVEIDPLTLETRRIAGADDKARLQGVSTALAVGDDIWVGTYDGDRIGYFPGMPR